MYFILFVGIQPPLSGPSFLVFNALYNFLEFIGFISGSRWLKVLIPVHKAFLSIHFFSNTTSGIVLVLGLLIWSNKECGFWSKIILWTNLKLDSSRYSPGIFQLMLPITLLKLSLKQYCPRTKHAALWIMLSILSLTFSSPPARSSAFYSILERTFAFI